MRFLRVRSRNGVLLTRGNHVTGIHCACYGYYKETQRGVRCIHENRQPRGPHPLQSISKEKGGEIPPRQTQQQTADFFYEARLLVDSSDTLLDLNTCSLGCRYIQIFRTRPDQAGKSQVEVAKAAGEGWRSLTQEEKDVSLPSPSYLCLLVINIAEFSSSNIVNTTRPSQLPPRKAPELSGPSGS